MKRIYVGAGVLVPSVAVLLWLTAPISGKGGHGVVHGSPHVGSVHFGARPAPVHVGGYRNPYRDEYFRRFRPGYFPLYLNGAQFYGYYSLPIGCPPVIVNGLTYYYCGGIYYQPYIYGGQTVYMVAPM